MPPQSSTSELNVPADNITKPDLKTLPREYNIVYWNVFVFIYYHIAAFYGIFYALTTAKWTTLVFHSILFYFSAVGVIAGAHRLWTHRSYKARKPLQLFLMLCHSIANQHSVIHWARDHRLHHKFSDTDSDPHNASRGFFYSHIGWLMVRKHPEVRKKGKLIDVSDLMENSLLSFQHRHNLWFIPLLAFIIPTFIPYYFWNETLTGAWNTNMLRYIINLNITLTINSIAHMWGNKPYEKEIAPTQIKALFYLCLGEGSHNYHHVFPNDYKSDGMGLFGVVTKFIDGCAFFGLAYDRKVADREMVKTRAERTGDGSP